MVNHTCRHGYTSQNILAICDFDMRFIFVVAGWPGSAHDSRILSHALANFPSFPVPPKGKKKKFLIKGLLFASFLFALLFGFDNPSFVGKYYLVDSTELDTLSLLKEPHTIFQNFSIVLASSTREV